MEKPAENNLKTLISKSGNSDVDLNVTIDIDTIPIAYGMMCSLYAKGELTEQQLEKAIQKLEELIERDKRKRKPSTYLNNENKPKLFDFPERNTRRRWL